MKSLIKIAGMVAVVGSMLISCVVHEPHPGRRGRPPGHVKKIHMHEKRGGHGHGHGHGHHKHRGRGHHR